MAGGGHVAALIASRLSREGNEVVLVEREADRCAWLEEHLDARVVEGNAGSVLALRRAGLDAAEMLIAVTDSDEVNLQACLIAQSESEVRVKLLRLRTHEVDHWKRITQRIGIRIDKIIHPETMLAERIMPVLRIPGVSEILEFADGKARCFGMSVDPGGRLAGRTLEDLQRAGPPENSLIAMIHRGQQVIIPHGAEVLRPGDRVYVMTTRERFDEALQFMGLEMSREIQRVFIVGGKQLGILIAEILEKQGCQVKLFEKDKRRCEMIAGLLEKTVVIHADGTEESALQDENIEGVDAFLALTNHDEDNVIASLLARRLGARKVVALINRLNYLTMAERLGVHATVSPRLATADGILQFVRKGRVLSVTTIQAEEAEAIELIASAGSKYVGRALQSIRFPRGVIVGAIVRPDGEVVVPRGDATIRVGDRVIFFTLESLVRELESAFLAS